MRFRSALVLVVAAAVTGALAAPAFAHEEINPKTIVTGQSAFLTLTAANESSTDLVKLVLKAPAGLGFGSATRSPAGWSAARAGDTVTWTGGALKPGTFDTWGFEVEGADQPGTFTYKVGSTFANGRTDEHEVDLTATAPGSGGTATAAPTNTSATIATTAPSVPPTTVPAGDSGEAAGDDDSDEDSGLATAALGLSIVALLAAGAALAMGARRRGGPSGAGTGGGGTPGAAQDW
jgi:periplasmic copper chaperone A